MPPNFLGLLVANAVAEKVSFIQIARSSKATILYREWKFCLVLQNILDNCSLISFHWTSKSHHRECNDNAHRLFNVKNFQMEMAKEFSIVSLCLFSARCIKRSISARILIIQFSHPDWCLLFMPNCLHFNKHLLVTGAYSFFENCATNGKIVVFPPMCPAYCAVPFAHISAATSNRSSVIHFHLCS